MPGTEHTSANDKATLRARLIDARRTRPEVDRRAARAAVGTHVLQALAGHRCVAGYLPLASEPFDAAVLDVLARSARVLVPAVTGAAPLDWCEHPGPTRRGAFGIDEPAGPRLGAEAITTADAVLVPALAVDRRGHRLGRGGGHYDRTLALLAMLLGPAALPPRIALINDDELLDEVPADALDQPVSAVITPGGGLVRVG